jgi:hypothetical protein
MPHKDVRIDKGAHEFLADLLARGTLSAILRQSSVTVSQFIGLL